MTSRFYRRCKTCDAPRRFDWQSVVYSNGLITVDCPVCGAVVLVGSYTD